MLNRRRLLSAAVATSALSLGVRPSIMKAADDYPNRLIRIIVGYATGGNVDVPARLFAPELQRILGVPVIIEKSARRERRHCGRSPRTYAAGRLQHHLGDFSQS
jgi:tripartite-type tricarboxylate transporter receptor subunit TctC